MQLFIHQLKIRLFFCLFFLILLLMVGINAQAQHKITATGGGNIFNVQYPANLPSVPNGLKVTFFSNQTITSPAQLNLNSFGNAPILKNATTPLDAGDIIIGQAVTVIYDGTNWQMLSTLANTTPTSNLWTVSGTNLFPFNLNDNVGIGTSSPFNVLSLVGNTTPAVDLGTFLDIQNTNGSQGALSGIRFKTNTATTNTRYDYAIFNYWSQPTSVTAYNMSFAVKDNNTATNISTADIKMNITDAGNVGIGTTVPSAKLDVDAGAVLVNSTIGNGSARPPVTNTRINGEISARGVGASTSLGSDDGFLRLSAGGGTNATNKSYIDLTGFSSITDMSNNIVLGTRGTEKMRILSNGNVGIGTTTPNRPLEVSSVIRISGPAPGDGTTLEIVNTGKTIAGTANSWNIFNMSGVYGNKLSFWAYDIAGTLNFEMFSVYDDGIVYIPKKLGIGTPSPSATLDVNGSIAISNTTGIVTHVRSGLSNNLIPLAYFFVKGGATPIVSANTSNVTFNNRSATGAYEFDITGENFNATTFSNYIVVATLEGFVAGGAIRWGPGSTIANTLRIATYNSAGTSTDYNYSVIIYKP